MKTSKPEPKYARTAEDVPLFPYGHARMTSSEPNSIEQAQFDFVQQAGQPTMPPNAESEEEQK